MEALWFILFDMVVYRGILFFFFFRDYFLETLNTCGYNYQVHTGILILYNGTLTS